MESPVVEALVRIMDVYNDGKENEEGRGSNEEHDYHERGGDIRGR